MIKIKTHGWLWIWLHCKKTKTNDYVLRGSKLIGGVYVNRKGKMVPRLCMPCMAEQLVGKIVEADRDENNSDTFPYHSEFAVPWWIVKEEITE